MRFLFWNLNRLPRQNLLAAIAHEHDADVVIVAECDVPDADVLVALGASFRKPRGPDSKIRVFHRLAADAILQAYDDISGRLTIREVVSQNRSILLAAVHFHSKINWTDQAQQSEMERLAGQVRQIEAERGHRRTVLVGDLNMNPFEAGVVSSHGLHGVMTQEIARRGTRLVAGSEYPFFYNPMWGLFGDRTEGPAGTHFYREPHSLAYFWNMFDQVLVRPELLTEFEGVRILDSCGPQSLITKNGRPNRTVGSDHLPIVFGLRVPT